MIYCYKSSYKSVLIKVAYKTLCSLVKLTIVNNYTKLIILVKLGNWLKIYSRKFPKSEIVLLHMNELSSES